METILYPRGVMSRVDSQDITVLFSKLSVNLGYEGIWNSKSNNSVCIGFNLKFHRPKNPTTWQNATVQSVLSNVRTWRWTPQILQKLVNPNDTVQSVLSNVRTWRWTPQILQKLVNPNDTVQSVLSNVRTWRWTPQILQKLVNPNDTVSHPTTLQCSAELLTELQIFQIKTYPLNAFCTKIIHCR